MNDVSAAFILQAIEEHPRDIGDELEMIGPDLTLDQSVALLQGVRAERRELSVIERGLEQVVVELAGKARKFNVEGVGAVEVRKKTNRTKWDNHSLYKVVVARALDERILDETTGDYEPEGQAVARVLEECARPSWRLTPLRARHITVDEYCETEDAGWTVSVL